MKSFMFSLALICLVSPLCAKDAVGNAADKAKDIKDAGDAITNSQPPTETPSGTQPAEPANPGQNPAKPADPANPGKPQGETPSGTKPADPATPGENPAKPAEPGNKDAADNTKKDPSDKTDADKDPKDKKDKDDKDKKDKKDKRGKDGKSGGGPSVSAGAPPTPQAAAGAAGAIGGGIIGSILSGGKEEKEEKKEEKKEAPKKVSKETAVSTEAVKEVAVSSETVKAAEPVLVSTLTALAEPLFSEGKGPKIAVLDLDGDFGAEFANMLFDALKTDLKVYSRKELAGKNYDTKAITRVSARKIASEIAVDYIVTGKINKKTETLSLISVYLRDSVSGDIRLTVSQPLRGENAAADASAIVSAKIREQISAIGK